MPQRATLTVPASQLASGDRIVQVGNLKGHHLCGKIIQEISIKTKLAHILPVKGVRLTLPLSAEVIVERNQQTAEERAAADHKYATAYIQRQIDAAPGHVEEAKAELVKDLEYAPSYWPHKLAELAEARVWSSLWSKVQKAAVAGSYRGGMGCEFERGDLVAAARAVVAEIRSDVLEFRPASRSTSVLHNALADVELSARLVWARHLGYYVRDL